ncbi:MAG: RdgB/HAM1 family non-canonical purine NTP pyrophosphatase [Treponema sp.]|jgi:XTP/dITP diphosphohydrolase|nr:RdgB/HAM1 family non-canonical purine NTP pyrophosphatase [Treponema sp.]
MILWFATGNAHKRAELAGILKGHEIRIPADAGIAGFDPEETGRSFLENSLLKARALYRRLARRGIRGPVIADDSGLCVDALGGRPGIYSARYAGPLQIGSVSLGDGERNALLLGELGKRMDRSARFVCAMVLFWDEYRFYGVQETLEGELVAPGEEGRGKGGFGYDPILSIPELGRTVAELSEEEKNRVSHRGKAARALAALLAGDGAAGDPCQS